MGSRAEDWGVTDGIHKGLCSSLINKDALSSPSLLRVLSFCFSLLLSTPPFLSACNSIFLFLFLSASYFFPLSFSFILFFSLFHLCISSSGWEADNQSNAVSPRTPSLPPILLTAQVMSFFFSWAPLPPCLACWLLIGG